MARFQALVLVGLGFCPAVLHAQQIAATTPAHPQSPADVLQQDPEPKRLSRLPPNVSITTPDGKPLPPDVLEKVIDLLANDPEIKAVSLNPSQPAARKAIGGAEIVVTAKRARGRVFSTIEPARTLNAIDLRAYGATTVSDLVRALGDEASSSRVTGNRRPLLLLNGRRITSFEEIALYPSEAIERMEVFPEAAALEYGYPPDQKVVNLVTFKFFSQESARTAISRTTSGGGARDLLSAQILRIVDEKRYDLAASIGRSGQILESQRDLEQLSGNTTTAAFRSLLPSTREITASGSYSGLLVDRMPFTVRLAGSWSRAEALLGDSASGRLSQVLSGQNVTIGTAIGGELGKWSWSSTATHRAEQASNSVRTSGALNPANSSRFGLSRSAVDATLAGSLFKLPAGSALSTFRSELDYQIIDPAVPKGLETTGSLSRRVGGITANLTFPLIGRDKTPSVPLGDLSVGGSLNARNLSDLGTFIDWSANVHWSPIAAFRIFASRGKRTRAPGLDQLRSPLITLPNVRVFDFTRGDTLEVSQTSGGNDRLRNEQVRQLDVGLEVTPSTSKSLALTFDFSQQRTSDAILPFPILNEDVLDAFPDRFDIDAQDRVTSVDVRPINAREIKESKVRVGLSWTTPLSSAPSAGLIFSPAADGPPPPGTLPPNARIIENPPGTPLPPEIVNALSRVYLSVFYTRRIQSEIRLTANGPLLNLLDGFALNSLGGRPRHELALTGGLFRRGLGVRTSLNWRSGSRVSGGSNQMNAAPSQLEFRYKPIVNMDLFLNPEDRIIGNMPSWIKGTQIVLSIANAANARPSVKDGAGRTPLRFQPAYLDPIGRSLELSVRKVF